MIETLTDALTTEFSLFIEFLPRLVTALVIFFIIYFFGKLLATGVLQIIKRSTMPETYHVYFKKLIKSLVAFGGFIVFLNLIGYSTLAASLVAGGGLTAVMLGFAFKDIGENFLAGFFLAFSRPFTTNDVIETGGITGQVKSIELRNTHIRTSEGCDVFVPSAQLFTQPLYNYTLDGLRRGNFTIGVDFRDNTQQALEHLLDVVKSTPGVLKSPKADASIKGFTQNYIELQVFFWINAKDQEFTLLKVRTSLMNRCRLRLIEEKFTFSSEVTTAMTMAPVDVNISNYNDKSNTDF